MLGQNALSELDLSEFQKNRFQILRVRRDLETQLVEIFRLAADYFATDTELKLGDRLNSDAGYRPFGVEYSQSPDRPDQIESFSYLPAAAMSELRSERAVALFSAMSSLYPVMGAAAETFAKQLFERVTEADPVGTFANGFAAYSHLQVNHEVSYGNRETDLDAHEDGNLLTIMTNTGPGLEIQSADGSFQRIELQQNEVIVISGEILWLLSGGLFRPTHHRVKPQGRDRMALLFFADLDPAMCSPWRIAPMNQFIDIAQRSRSNAARFGLKARG